MTPRGPPNATLSQGGTAARGPCSVSGTGSCFGSMRSRFWRIGWFRFRFASISRPVLRPVTRVPIKTSTLQSLEEIVYPKSSLSGLHSLGVRCFGDGPRPLWGGNNSHGYLYALRRDLSITDGHKRELPATKNTCLMASALCTHGVSRCALPQTTCTRTRHQQNTSKHTRPRPAAPRVEWRSFTGVL